MLALDLLSFYYKLIGACFFYIFIFLYIFDRGLFNTSSPSNVVNLIKVIVDFLNKKILYKFAIFPPWTLFTRLDEKFFYDLKIVATTTTNKKYTWYLTKDNRVGNLKFKNRHLMKGLVSHYWSNKTNIHRICKKSVLQFLTERGEAADTLTIKNTQFDLLAEDDEIDNRNCSTEIKNLRSYDFFWKNPNTNNPAENLDYNII